MLLIKSAMDVDSKLIAEYDFFSSSPHSSQYAGLVHAVINNIESECSVDYSITCDSYLSSSTSYSDDGSQGYFTIFLVNADDTYDGYYYQQDDDAYGNADGAFESDSELIDSIVSSNASAVFSETRDDDKLPSLINLFIDEITKRFQKQQTPLESQQLLEPGRKLLIRPTSTVKSMGPILSTASVNYANTETTNQTPSIKHPGLIPKLRGEGGSGVRHKGPAIPAIPALPAVPDISTQVKYRKLSGQKASLPCSKRNQADRFKGYIGYGLQGDMCMYSNFDNLSQGCQSAINDLFVVRQQFVQDNQEHAAGHNGHHAFVFISLIVLSICLLVRLTRKILYRDHRRKLKHIMNTIVKSPSLKAAVEAEAKCEVPTLQPYNLSLATHTCGKVILLLIFAAFFAVISSCIIYSIVDSVKNPNPTSSQSQHVLSIVALLSFLGLIIFLFSTIARKCYTSQHPSHRNAQADAPPAISSGNGFFNGLFCRIQPARSDSSVYVQLLNDDYNTEMIPIYQAQPGVYLPPASVSAKPLAFSSVSML